MNYLAHAALAESTDEARLGSLLGDFRRGLEPASLPSAVLEAISEHQAIDVWFDAHPLVKAERAAFPAHLRRFGGILIDVFVDHFLVRRWRSLGPEPLPEVTGSLYRALETYAAQLPPRLARSAPHMISNDWLAGYGEVENVERALGGIAQRLRKPTPLTEGIDVLHARYAELDELTLEVFPEALSWVRERRQS